MKSSIGKEIFVFVGVGVGTREDVCVGIGVDVDVDVKGFTGVFEVVLWTCAFTCALFI